MPGAVNTSAAPSVERFCAAKFVGVARGDLVRDARLAVGHLVVALGVDDPLEGVAVVAMGERVRDRRHRAVPRRSAAISASRIGWTNWASHWRRSPRRLLDRGW